MKMLIILIDICCDVFRGGRDWRVKFWFVAVHHQLAGKPATSTVQLVSVWLCGKLKILTSKCQLHVTRSKQQASFANVFMFYDRNFALN